MRCPSCGTEHDVDRFGRFCEACGLSVGSTGRPVRRPPPDDEGPRACPSCGVPAASADTARCIACGSRIPLPGGET